jgi:heavy metal translocating P-type ATPase
MGEQTSADEILAPINHPLRLLAIGAMALAAAASFLHLYARLHLGFDWIGLVATLVGGWPIWMEAWEAIREKQINMEITMALGVAAALAIGQFATAAIIVAFTLFSMYLEALTRSRGKHALEVLIRNAPESAAVQRDGAWVEASAESLRPGDLILVRPGDKVPADGRVVRGESHVAEAAITGEPTLRPKGPGATVYAGTVNGNAALEVEVARAGQDTTYARIVHLVREAGERRGRRQRLADLLAQGIVYVVLAAAAMTFLLTRNLTSTISVVLVAGACGVAAGTPLAILATTAQSARRGIIIKGGEAVEALATVDTVVFDKTGTLTRGVPSVERVEMLGPGSRDAFLGTISAVEQGSDHPVALAIRNSIPPTGRAEGVHYVAGRGMLGQVAGEKVLVGNADLLQEHGIHVDAAAKPAEAGELVVYGAVGSRLRGVIHLADEPRPEARDVVLRLRRMGLRVIMLTGDQPGPARRLGAAVGIDDIQAGLLPEDKIRIVRQLRQQGRRVCFVGDGINDTPALVESNVGVAVGSGSEAALETADVLLMSSDLNGLAQAIAGSRKSQGVILFNFGGTLAVDFAGIVLASLGLLGPLLAALVHVGSELAFILNSARLFGKPGT